MKRDMDGSTLPRDATRLRRHIHGDGFGYGWLLILILISITFQLAAPETDVAQVITIGLQGVHADRRPARLRGAHDG